MSRIKIIAIGSGGNYVLNRLLELERKNVDCIAADANMESLDRSKAEIKILLGKGITDGGGSSSNPVTGRKATLESYDEIRAALKGAEIVILLIGMGGGTGTGGAPVVAALAKEMGAEVIAVVSTPFAFEGNRRHEQAKAGLEALKEEVYSIIIVSNQTVLKTLGRDSTLLQVFNESDRLMSLLVEYAGAFFIPVIGDECSGPKLLAGEIVGFGFGSAFGTNRAMMAMNNALASPALTRQAIKSSNGILVDFSGPGDMKLTEVMDDILFITRHNEKIEDNICITIILFNRPSGRI